MTFGDSFFKIVEEGIINLFDKTHESMGLYNGKTTTNMLPLCSDPDSVDGETSEFGTAINHE